MTQPILLRVGRVFAPEPLGRQDVLLAGGRILAVAPNLEAAARGLGVTRVLDRPHGTLLPGLIDQHMHFLGGGEGDGPGARMPELSFQDIASHGITTAAGLLGTEIRFKTLPLLLARANELAAQGLTTFIYTGAMALPPPTLLHDVFSDIVLIDRVIGVKSAVGERLFPNADPAALAHLAGQAAQARAVSGKAAVLHVHVGRQAEGMAPVFELTRRFDLPPDQIVPTHVNRAAAASPAFAQGLHHARAGGTIDLTCCLGPLDGLPAGMDVVDAVATALAEGVPGERITLSSDAGVAVPDGAGGYRRVEPAILFRDVRRLAREGGLGWAAALAFATTNVARVLRLGGKGCVAPGCDADLMLLDEADCIEIVLVGGNPVPRRAKTACTGLVSVDSTARQLGKQ